MTFKRNQKVWSQGSNPCKETKQLKNEQIMKTYLNIPYEEIFKRCINEFSTFENEEIVPSSRKAAMLNIRNVKEGIEYSLNELWNTLETSEWAFDTSRVINRLKLLFSKYIANDLYLSQTEPSEYAEKRLFICDSRYFEEDIKTTEDALIVSMTKEHEIQNAVRELRLFVLHGGNYLSSPLNTSKTLNLTLSNKTREDKVQTVHSSARTRMILWLMRNVHWAYRFLDNIGALTTYAKMSNTDCNVEGRINSNEKDEPSSRMNDLCDDMLKFGSEGMYYELEQYGSPFARLLESVYNWVLLDIVVNSTDEAIECSDDY